MKFIVEVALSDTWQQSVTIARQRPFGKRPFDTREEALMALGELKLDHPLNQERYRITELNPKPEELYTVSDWKSEVENDDTVLGYAEWVQHQVEANS